MAAQTLVTHAQPAETAGSPATAERIEIVDILRGFALFGILLVNMAPFKAAAGPPSFGADGPLVDRLASLGILLLAQSKFFTLFSFLFGFGFAIQLLRAQARGVPFVPRFARRLLVLLVFGLLHAVLIWDGDILTLYALFGFVLLLFRDSAPRTLLRWSAGLLLVQLLLLAAGIGVLAWWSATPAGAAQIVEVESVVGRELAATRADALHVYGAGSYGEILAERVSGLPFVWGFLLSLQATPVFAMFLLGLYVGRRGILQRPDEHLALLRRTRFWGLLGGLLVNLLIVGAFTQVGPVAALLVLGLNFPLGGPLLSMGYAATLALLVRRERWQCRLAPLAATGRMALTNYLLQSLICTTLFYGYGFGLFGRFGPAAGVLIAIVIYALQIPWSVWWLRRFQFGPMEWLWRSLTYGRVQPMRRQFVPNAGR